MSIDGDVFMSVEHWTEVLVRSAEKKAESGVRSAGYGEASWMRGRNKGSQAEIKAKVLGLEVRYMLEYMPIRS